MPHCRRALNPGRTYFLTSHLQQRHGNTRRVGHFEKLQYGVEMVLKHENELSALAIDADIRRNALRLLRPTGLVKMPCVTAPAWPFSTNSRPGSSGKLRCGRNHPGWTLFAHAKLPVVARYCLRHRQGARRTLLRSQRPNQCSGAIHHFHPAAR